MIRNPKMSLLTVATWICVITREVMEGQPARINSFMEHQVQAFYSCAADCTKRISKSWNKSHRRAFSGPLSVLPRGEACCISRLPKSGIPRSVSSGIMLTSNASSMQSGGTAVARTCLWVLGISSLRDVPGARAPTNSLMCSCMPCPKKFGMGVLLEKYNKQHGLQVPWKSTTWHIRLVVLIPQAAVKWSERAGKADREKRFGPRASELSKAEK